MFGHSWSIFIVGGTDHYNDASLGEISVKRKTNLESLITKEKVTDSIWICHCRSIVKIGRVFQGQTVRKKSFDDFVLTTLVDFSAKKPVSCSRLSRSRLWGPSSCQPCVSSSAPFQSFKRWWAPNCSLPATNYKNHPVMAHSSLILQRRNKSCQVLDNCNSVVWKQIFASSLSTYCTNLWVRFNNT